MDKLIEDIIDALSDAPLIIVGLVIIMGIGWAFLYLIGHLANYLNYLN